VTRFDEIRRRLSARYVGRERVIRLLQLAVICREHVLLLGPPGTAKTDLVVTFAHQIGAVPFRSLLTRFTEPADLFGPLDVEEFRAGRYQVRTEGMLPGAELAVLDEMFQGSSAILNTLLSVIGDRCFHNGRETVPVPLLSLIGTGNALPVDPGLAAFADRFLLRARVTPVAQDRFDELIRHGSEIEAQRMASAIQANVTATRSGGGAGPGAPGSVRGSGFTVKDVNLISRHLASVDTGAVHSRYRQVVQGLLQEQVELSDRRIVQGLKLVRGAALLRRATIARPADLWPLAHLWTNEEDEQPVAEMVQRVVEEDGGDPLDHAVTPEQIAREAEFARQRFETGQDRSPGAIDAALIEINRLRDQLVARHPTAHAERDRIDAASAEIQRYHDPDWPGPDQPEPSTPTTGGEHV
jgi:MoxR-like ATPase